jgi:hypothetical protein
MSNASPGRPGTPSIAEALARAKANQFKAGVRDVTTAERIYAQQKTAVSTSNLAVTGSADARLRWTVLAAVGAGCVALALIAVFVSASLTPASNPDEKPVGGERVENLPRLLYNRTESGRIVTTDGFAPAGSNYQIHYHENGRFTFSSNGYAQHGLFYIQGNQVCRGKTEAEVESSCAAVFDMGDGRYQARDLGGTKVLYTFRMG